MKFLDRLRGYDKQRIDENILKKVKVAVYADNFNPIKMEKQSKVGAALAKWCKATYEYAEAWKIVKPKEEKQRQLIEEFRSAESEVAMKKGELYKVQSYIANMEAEYDNLQKYIITLSEEKILCEKRLINAGKLIGLLGDEGARW